MSGSGSAGGSKSDSKSSASTGQTIFNAKAYKRLSNQASRLWEGASQQDLDFLRGQIPGLTQQSAGIFDTSNPFWQKQMQGGVYSGINDDMKGDLVNSLRQSMSGPSETGKMYNSIVGGEGNSYIDPMVGAMKRGAIDNMNRFGMTGISDDATAAGQNGSSRQGIAEGLLKSDVNKQMMDKEAMMRGEAYDKDLQMKLGIASLADSNRGASQDRAIGLLNAANANTNDAINYGQGMQQLSQGAMNPGITMAQMPWQLMRQYSSTLGGPQTLTSGNMSSKSHGAGMGGGSSASMGK